MKVQPVAFNHIHLHLNNGEILDINDVTLVPSGGQLNIVLSPPSNKFMLIKENNDELIKIEFRNK